MRKLVLLLAVFALTLMGVTAATSAEAMRGFNGKATGEVTFIPAPADSGCQYPPPPVGPFKTISDGVGSAAQMGEVVVDFEHCSGDNIAGAGTISGAKGDVYVSYEGPCTPYVPGLTLVECDLDFVITGGTERYDGATGGGELDATVLPQEVGPWPTTWTWKGRISY